MSLPHAFCDGENLISNSFAHLLRQQVFLGKPFQAATVRSAVSVTIFHKGLAGRRAASANRRTWSVEISLRLRLPPKLSARLSFGM